MSLEVLLQNSPWMSGLNAAEQNKVRTDIQIKQIPAEGFICRRGHAADFWFGVISGVVKINNVAPSGKSTTLLGLAPGSWFGEGSLLKDESRRYDAITLRDSELALMPRATFLWLLDHSIFFNRFLISQLNKRLGQFIGAMENERLLDVDARVARSLAAMFDAWYPQQSMMLKISQEEVGQLAGLSRQRVNSALKVLEERGLIRVCYGEIHILDIKNLSTFDSTSQDS
ncbi:MAG: Crp/Fnr family transcriptional regulator [Polynucleobacter sp.]